ncbi:hypothetical protein [Kineosporia babensis]|uniref:Uncharacterized protein n=1 Tax=Kineosporia babensis TaxID=499548 RepID=A0A9X1SRV3_9ACTN|nr:hypothetical protein [Kineosporia babensis]MCD5309984.1 hypothetical protein [Kineosporia babensis]
MRDRILSPGEAVTDVVAGKHIVLVSTAGRGLTAYRPDDWGVAKESWVDDVLRVEGPEPMTHVEPEIFAVIYAKDGETYVLGLHGEDDLEALAGRLVLPGDLAISATALAEQVALHRVGGYFHGTLVEGSVWGEPLAGRYPAVLEQVSSVVHPVRLERAGEQARLEFFSYTSRPIELNLWVTVDRWTVDVLPGRPVSIQRATVTEVEGHTGEQPPWAG